MRVLVVSAHPDDEVIGMGGTILRHKAQGHDVHWCIVTSGYEPEYTKEHLMQAAGQVAKVAKMLGVKSWRTLNYPTVRLNTVPQGELAKALSDVVVDVMPELVYTTPLDDINGDHRLVGEATLVATRPLPGSSVRKVLTYEIGPTARYRPTASAPNVFVNISEYLERKLEIMAVYETELRLMPHPRSIEGLRIIALERGLSVGLPSAEAFWLVRAIEN